MRIAEAKKKTAKKWTNIEVTWDQFRAKLTDALRTKETMREYKAMSKPEKDVLKELPGGFVAGYLIDGVRKNANVRERSMITLDADHATPRDWNNFCLLYGEYEAACYPTHSSTPEHPRLRWIFPLSRPVTPDEYPAVARRVAEWVNIDTVDPTSHDLCRLFYYPGVPVDAPYALHYNPGKFVDPDEILASYGPGDAWKDSTRWPIGKDESEPRVSDRLKKLGDPCEKPGIIGLFCRTFDVEDAINAFLGDKYEEAGPGRYTYLGGSTAGGARVYNGGQYLYSSHATDPAGGYSCNSFDLVRIHKFGHLDSETGEDTDVTKLPSYKAMQEWASDLPEVKEQMVAEKQAEITETFGDMLGTKTAAGSVEGGEQGQDEGVEDSAGAEDGPDMAWTKKLKTDRKTGECAPNIANALLILLNDPDLKGALAYDTFSEKPVLRHDVPWRPAGSVKTSGRGTNWVDRDEAGVRLYMQEKYNFKSENDLRNAIELAMHANEFHPIQEYLNGLVWDGVERLDTLFIDFLGAEDNAYVRAATRRWMCGAVARAMVPGCKFDQAIVLNSRKQGLGKSAFARIMSRGWYSDSIISMNDKDGYASLHGNWIIELAELASVRRNDVEPVKNFISKQEDTYRPAYARRTATFPRQCVFYGTTNETEYLKDRTGNRRFWSIDVEGFADQNKMSAAVDQVWAEAVVRWKAGERLYFDEVLDADLIRLWEESVDRHTVQDDLEGLIMDFLDKPLPDNWSDLSPESRRDWINEDIPGAAPGTAMRMKVCLPEIKTELLKEDRAKGSGNDLLTRRVANIMNNAKGWVKSRHKTRVKGYGNQWVYTRTDEDRARLEAERLEDLLS